MIFCLKGHFSRFSGQADSGKGKMTGAFCNPLWRNGWGRKGADRAKRYLCHAEGLVMVWIDTFLPVVTGRNVSPVADSGSGSAEGVNAVGDGRDVAESVECQLVNHFGFRCAAVRQNDGTDVFRMV